MPTRLSKLMQPEVCGRAISVALYGCRCTVRSVHSSGANGWSCLVLRLPHQ